MSDEKPQHLSTFQRFLNFVRFWYHIRANVTVVLHNEAQIAGALQNTAAHINRLNARLEWYEREVLLIGKAGASFRAHERKEMQSAQAQADYAEREKRREEMAVVG